jgi:hypothetical protein
MLTALLCTGTVPVAAGALATHNTLNAVCSLGDVINDEQQRTHAAVASSGGLLDKPPFLPVGMVA